MKVLLDGEPGSARTYAAVDAYRREARPRGDSGIVARFRFLYELPAGPLEVRPELPSDRLLHELVAGYAIVLEGVLWESAGQIAVIHAAREWARVAGVEVSL